MLLIAICNRNLLAGPDRRKSRFLTETLRIMQLSAVFILGLCFQVAAAGHAQNISYEGRDVSLTKVFAEIKKQTGFKTVYDKPLIDGKKVTFHADDLSLENL
jgi:hypothetical protein